MLDLLVQGLIEGQRFAVIVEGQAINLELRRRYSLLASEHGNSVGYIDFIQPPGYFNCETERGQLGVDGFVMDSRHFFHEDFEPGLKGHSTEWGFFINEQYRGRRIGVLMFSTALGIARVLVQRPQKGIEIDWDYLGAKPGNDLNSSSLKLNQGYMAVCRMVSGFYQKYFFQESRLKPGVEFSESYSDFFSAVVYPEFAIPDISGIVSGIELISAGTGSSAPC